MSKCDCNLIFKAIEIHEGVKCLIYICNKCPKIVKYEDYNFLSKKKRLKLDDGE